MLYWLYKLGRTRQKKKMHDPNTWRLARVIYKVATGQVAYALLKGIARRTDADYKLGRTWQKRKMHDPNTWRLARVIYKVATGQVDSYPAGSPCGEPLDW